MVRLLRIAPIAWMLFVSLIVSTAAGAQRGTDREPPEGGPPPGGPPRGGPGMFGGPGGGSLSGQYGRLLNIPTVQKELGLTESQQTKVKEVTEKARGEMREMFSGMRGLTEEQRRAKFAELEKKMQARMEETSKAIESTLQPSQSKRLLGIAIQVAGVQAFADKQLQKDLKLSEDQILEINLINENTSKEMRGLFSNRGGDREAIRTKLDEIRKAAEKEVLAELTAEQKTTLEQLKGAKIEIPMSELRPGRPGSRGGPPNGPPPDGPPPDDRGGRRRGGGSDDR